MMLSEDEIVHILTEEDFHGTNTGHGLSKFKRSKWPGGIVPYTLDESASRTIHLIHKWPPCNFEKVKMSLTKERIE